MTQQSPTLLSRLAAGETVFTAWSAIPDPLVVEILAGQGFDAVTLDMQHGGHHEDSVLRSVPKVLSAGKHAVVRIPVGRFDMASRALDFGAEAVIAPMINSVADARSFAAAMKFPPLGERSWGPSFALLRTRSDSKRYFAEANGRALSFAMIETRQAYDALDGILETPGIDGIFVGPSDFSITLSNGATNDPLREDMMEAVADVAGRAVAAGKVAAMYVNDPAYVGRYAAMGYRFQSIASDHGVIGLGSRTQLAAAKASLAG